MTDGSALDALAALRQDIDRMHGEIEATARIRKTLEHLESSARSIAYAPDLGAIPADGSTSGITVELQSYALGSADGLAFAIGYIRAALNGTPRPDADDAFQSAGIRSAGRSR